MTQIEAPTVRPAVRRFALRLDRCALLTDLAHDAFLNRAKADPGLKEVYRDQYAIAYAVVN